LDRRPLGLHHLVVPDLHISPTTPGSSFVAGRNYFRACLDLCLFSVRPDSVSLRLSLILSMLLSLLLSIAAFLAPPSQAAPYNIRWALIRESDSITEAAAKDFAARVAQGSEGQIHVEIVTPQQYWGLNGKRPPSQLRALKDLW